MRSWSLRSDNRAGARVATTFPKGVIARPHSGPAQQAGSTRNAAPSGALHHRFTNQVVTGGMARRELNTHIRTHIQKGQIPRMPARKATATMVALGPASKAKVMRYRTLTTNSIERCTKTCKNTYGPDGERCMGQSKWNRSGKRATCSSTSSWYRASLRSRG